MRLVKWLGPYERVVALVVSSAAFSGVALAQNTGAKQGGGTSAPAAGPTSAPSPPPSTTQPTTTTPPALAPSSATPVYLSGRVTIAGGGTLSGQAAIELVCGSRASRAAYTDLEGYFNFALRQPAAAGDASEAATSCFGGLGGAGAGGNALSGGLLAAGELRAVLAGYRSETLSFRLLPGDNPDVGVIVLHPVGPAAEGSTFSATSDLAPKNAQKAYEKGKDLVRQGRPLEGQRELLKAVQLYPRYAVAWYELGQLYSQRDQRLEAREAYGKAIAADARFGSPYEGLYLLAFRESKWQEVADTSERLLRMNPYEFPGAYYFNAVANVELGHWDAAERSALEAVSRTSDQNPRAVFILGLIQFEKKEYEAAAVSLREFLKRAPTATDRPQAEKFLALADQGARNASATPPSQTPPSR
jgi:tetratricopeptide (TPR) repeat protein